MSDMGSRQRALFIERARMLRPTGIKEKSAVQWEGVSELVPVEVMMVSGICKLVRSLILKEGRNSAI